MLGAAYSHVFSARSTGGLSGRRSLSGPAVVDGKGVYYDPSPVVVGYAGPRERQVDEKVIVVDAAVVVNDPIVDQLRGRRPASGLPAVPGDAWEDLDHPIVDQPAIDRHCGGVHH